MRSCRVLHSARNPTAVVRHGNVDVGLRADSHPTKDESPRAALILLRHKFWRLCLAAFRPQQGHRGRVFTSALIKRTRMVAIEFGMWRSGRKGGSSGAITVG